LTTFSIIDGSCVLPTITKEVNSSDNQILKIKKYIV
jgi:hypothetical protein